MTLKASLMATALLLILLLGFSSLLWAQAAKAPTLDEVLARVESNTDRYDTRVPSLFCDEHVVSSYVVPRQHDQNTTTDSVFRLKSTKLAPGQKTVLVESREIQSVDGRPAKSQDLDGPTRLSGAFEGGLAVVSPRQRVCMKYEMERVHKKRSTDPYVIRFSTVLTPANSGACILHETSKGRALIDPTTMQILHLEITTPRHSIVDDSSEGDTEPLVGKREIAVDYASVLLGGETFWMPSTITMQVVSGAGTFHPVMWAFRATYRNYHKLEVTSRILP